MELLYFLSQGCKINLESTKQPPPIINVSIINGSETLVDIETKVANDKDQFIDCFYIITKSSYNDIFKKSNKIHVLMSKTIFAQDITHLIVCDIKLRKFFTMLFADVKIKLNQSYFINIHSQYARIIMIDKFDYDYKIKNGVDILNVSKQKITNLSSGPRYINKQEVIRCLKNGLYTSCLITKNDEKIDEEQDNLIENIVNNQAVEMCIINSGIITNINNKYSFLYSFNISSDINILSKRNLSNIIHSYKQIQNVCVDIKYNKQIIDMFQECLIDYNVVTNGNNVYLTTKPTIYIDNQTQISNIKMLLSYLRKLPSYDTFDILCLCNNFVDNEIDNHNTAHLPVLTEVVNDIFVKTHIKDIHKKYHGGSLFIPKACMITRMNRVLITLFPSCKTDKPVGEEKDKLFIKPKYNLHNICEKDIGVQLSLYFSLCDSFSLYVDNLQASTKTIEMMNIFDDMNIKIGTLLNNECCIDLVPCFDDRLRFKSNIYRRCERVLSGYKSFYDKVLCINSSLKDDKRMFVKQYIKKNINNDEKIMLFIYDDSYMATFDNCLTDLSNQHKQCDFGSNVFVKMINEIETLEECDYFCFASLVDIYFVSETFVSFYIGVYNNNLVIYDDTLERFLRTNIKGTDVKKFGWLSMNNCDTCE